MTQREIDEQGELGLMLRCVQLCFEGEKINQEKAAAELNTSVSKVSRLLKRAWDEGLIRVEYDFPEFPRLAASLIKTFGLRDAVIVPKGEEDRVKQDIGRAMARYFEKIASHGQRVGISCGRTLYYFVHYLGEGRFKDLSIYPLSNDLTVELVDLFPETLVGMMAAKYRPDVRAYAIHGPLLHSSQPQGKILKRLASESSRVYKESKNVDIAVLGIGSIKDDSNIPGFRQFAKLCGVSDHDIELHVAGEFNYQPFDWNGNPVRVANLKALSESTVAVRLEEFKEMAKDKGKHVIAGGGGAQKLEPIRSALKGQLFNVLITDHVTARELLE